MMPLALGLFACSAKESQRPVLMVLTHSAMAGPESAGPELKKKFEASREVRVELVNAVDPSLMLQRLRGAETFDVVLGLDELQTREILFSGIPALRPLAISYERIFPQLQAFPAAVVPISWSPLTILYRKSRTPEPPRSWDDVLRADFRKQLLVQDPRVTSSGQQFLAWFLMGVPTAERDARLTRLRENRVRVAPTWTQAHEVFLERKAQLVVGPLSALAYHHGVRKDQDLQAVRFEGGHPFLVEVAVVPARCSRCELAEEFVAFLTTPEAQKLLRDRNYQFPIRRDLVANSIMADLTLPPLVQWAELEAKVGRAGALSQLWVDHFRKD
jgi:thiamine transport system substrate-binding protein